MFVLYACISRYLGTTIAVALETTSPVLLSNDIRAAILTNPYLMDMSGLDVDSAPNTIRLLLWLVILWIRNGQLAS